MEDRSGGGEREYLEEHKQLSEFKGFQYNDSMENRLYRNFLKKWEETFPNSIQVAPSSGEGSSIHINKKPQESGQFNQYVYPTFDTGKTRQTKKVMDYKTKKFVQVEI